MITLYCWFFEYLDDLECVSIVNDQSLNILLQLIDSLIKKIQFHAAACEYMHHLRLSSTCSAVNAASNPSDRKGEETSVLPQNS